MNVKARGVGEMMAKVGGCGISVVTSSAGEDERWRGEASWKGLTSGLGVAGTESGHD